MHIRVFLLLIYFLTIPALAQVSNTKEITGQVQEQVNKIKKEIAALEKKIDDARINNEDPATIKVLEDTLAMMKEMLATIEDLNKDLLKTDDRPVNQAALDDNKETVPNRDSKRISMLPDKTLTDAELVVFVKKIHSEVERLLPAKYKTEASKIYDTEKAEKRSSNYINNVATNLWMTGYNELAIYILGKECTADTENDNNLSNYAAFLTMMHAEHAALPILQYLNNKYPSNSTILNNIGQAWYGLGDMNNANKFLDTAILLYPRHSQANQTKSRIQQSEGETQDAIESIKRAIKENYTYEKEARLNKLGGKLEYNDMPFRYWMKPEPLGIEKFMFVIPDYVTEGGTAAVISEMEWTDFRKKIAIAANKINDEIVIIDQKAAAYNTRFIANPMIQKPYSNSVYRNGSRKMQLLIEWFSERATRLDKKMIEAKDSVDKWNAEYYEAVNAHKNYNNSRGIEGDCIFLMSLAKAFNSKANALWQERNNELLTFYKQFLNTQANLSLYATTDKSLYDQRIAYIKKGFLGQLANLQCAYEVGCIPTMPEEKFGKNLPDFDSLTCQYKDEFFFPPFTTIKTECNKMSTEFNIDTELGLKIKIGWEEDLNRDKITKGTLELGYEAGADTHLGGPLKGELKAEAALGIEVTQEGIKEVYIKAGVSGELTGQIDELFQEETGFMHSKGTTVANLELKSSWNAGTKGKEGTIGTNLSGEALKNINFTTSQIQSN